MTNTLDTVPLSDQAKAELAPGGVLRAGINTGNPLLVTGRSASGDPEGVAPDMARAIAERLGVPVQLVPYASPAVLGDAVDTGAWDIGLIGAEPQRAEKIDFSNPYVEIEATYLVPARSSITSVSEVDRPGVRIAVSGRSAYGLSLERIVQHATLHRADSPEDAVRMFRDDDLDALASLRPALIEDAKQIVGSRVLDGQYASVQQAVGTSKQNAAGAMFLNAFLAEAKRSGFVASLIARHDVVGKLAVAP